MERIEKIRSSKGKTAAQFALKNEIIGSKKLSKEPTSIKFPVSNEMISEPERIKETVLHYCKSILTNRPPKDEYEDVKIKKILHEVRMQEKVEDDVELLSLEMFNNSLKQLWEKKDKYAFVLKSGYSLKHALFGLFNEVWQKTKIIQIFKGHGDFRDLNNTRFIHLKEILPKMYSHIVMGHVKDTIMSSLSPYQIGAKSGHRSQEHIFTLKSMMGKYEFMSKLLIVSSFDISKMFDAESLSDHR